MTDQFIQISGITYQVVYQGLVEEKTKSGKAYSYIVLGVEAVSGNETFSRS